MWIFFALLSGAFYTASNLLTRYVLKQQKDAWAFSFWFSAVGAAVSLPFLLSSFKLADSFMPWLLLLGVGLLIVIQNFLNFRSSNFIEASVSGSISKLRLVWVFLLGVMLLGESFTLGKLFGTALTVLAGVLLLFKYKKGASVRGILYALAATFFYAMVIVFYKSLFKSFSAESLTFFIFLIPAVMNFISMPQALRRVTKIVVEDGRAVILACVLGGGANLAMNRALSIGEASRVLVLIEAFLVIVLAGEHLLLKEKKYFLTKFLAVLGALLGGYLIR